MLFVLDTNIIISALLVADSNPEKALNHAEDNGIVLYSKEVLEEISTVLSRPKFSRYIDENDIDGFLARIHRSWKEIEIMHSVQACRDPKDDKFLELAVNGTASMIISGDSDLLDLDPFQNIPILSPAAFLKTDLAE